jgi:hypothetical protein
MFHNFIDEKVQPRSMPHHFCATEYSRISAFCCFVFEIRRICKIDELLVGTLTALLCYNSL